MDDFWKEDTLFQGKKKLLDDFNRWLKILRLQFRNFFFFFIDNELIIRIQAIVHCVNPYIRVLVCGFLVSLSSYGSTIKGHDKEKFETKGGLRE